MRRFRATIEAGRGGGAFVTIPFDVEKAFGKKRVAVRALIDGEPYRGSLVRMGTADHVLGVLKEIRTKIGKDVGAKVKVALEEDNAPRVINVPGDLEAALKSAPSARRFFEKLSYTHRREYVQWIESAKREETRRDRVARTVALLAQGKKTNSPG